MIQDSQNIHNCNMKSNILTIEQERFVLFLKLQKIPTYRIINYLTLLRNSEHLQKIWNWIDIKVHKTEEFPTESELVERIHLVLSKQRQ